MGLAIALCMGLIMTAEIRGGLTDDILYSALWDIQMQKGTASLLCNAFAYKASNQ